MSSYFKIAAVFLFLMTCGRTQSLKLSFKEVPGNLVARKAIVLENSELKADTSIFVESDKGKTLRFMEPVVTPGNYLVIRLLFDAQQYRYIADVQIPMPGSGSKKINYDNIKLCIVRNGDLSRGNFMLRPGSGYVQAQKIGHDSYRIFFDLDKITQPFPGVGKWNLKGEVVATLEQNPSEIFYKKRPGKGLSGTRLKHLEIAGVLGFIILALALSQ